MIGGRLGPYQIDRELGSGGMGKVFAATVAESTPGLATGARVALKVVHPHLLETPGFFKRFLREAQVGQSIRHENVVRTLDCDQEIADGKAQCFLVMEYVEGQTLADLRRELDKVPEELCRHVAREICKGLAAVHGAGVVHRDLKPENVLITADHFVKVMDLGVAQVADEALRLSQSGAFVGSVEYASPEQFRGGRVDGRTDLHALGLLLYELSSGVHPYRGGSFPEVLRRVCNEEPRRLGAVNPQLSAFFEEVVHTLLAKDPDGRFASAAQLLAVLEQGEDATWWHERARRLQADTKRPIRRIRIPRETAVYGRDAELATLRELFDRAKSGDGHVVLIEGEAGIGKSRLVDELIARLQADGEDVNFVFGSYPPGGAATAEGAFSAAYREHLGEEGGASHLRDNPILVPAFDALLRGEGAPPGAQPLTPVSLRTCFLRVTQSLAAERTTIVLIDDLHFAPDEGRALFSALAPGVSGHRVLLIGSTRPGISEEWRSGLTRLEHVTQMTVQRLGPKDLVRLLQDSLGSRQLAEDLGGKIAVKSDGNPFFAFEIVRGLRDGQFISRRDDGTWATTRVIDEIEIPSSVLDLVNARVADLTEEERDLLDVACCWGFEFDATLVGEALGVPRIPTLKRFAWIEKRHRLVRCVGEKFAFDHHQVQEALYDALPPQLAREYHAALAETLEARTTARGTEPAELDGALCVDLCEQYLKGARGQAALRYLASAQTHLERSYLLASSAALAERALAEPGLLSGRERAQQLLRLAGANGPLDHLHRRARQEECVREAERLCEEEALEDLRVGVAAARGNVCWRTARLAEAQAAYRRAIDAARARGDLLAEALGGVGLGNVLKSEARLRDAREQYERARALFREAGNARGEMITTGNLAVVLSAEGRVSEAIESHERARTICRETGNRLGEAIETGNLAVAFWSQGRLAEAKDGFERTLALVREIGDRGLEAWTLGNLGTVLRALGRVTDADDLHERSLEACREVGDAAGTAHALGNVASALSGHGRLAESRRRREEQLALARAAGDRQCEALALVNLGIDLSGLGERDAARTTLEEAVALCRELGLRRPEGYGVAGLGLLARDGGDTASARTLLGEALAIRRTIADDDGIADALILLGELDLQEGRTADAHAALGEALGLARTHGYPNHTARALCLLSRLPGGDVGAARAALAAAGDSATRIAGQIDLWRATRDRHDLREAKSLLDELLAKNPPEDRRALCANIPARREILDAWRALPENALRDDAPDADRPPGTEPATPNGPRG